ncbi:pyruvate dehydrogenase (acetyl-transferring) E1 component subunit alpha [Candidatus Lucifugimonas marina]|jgi:pyruvate dehydrogenase E1 component alpha subunit|uniref:Pyruvate dehydrogenase E1 component subunit alpha n=1 Tax=Candidatus Lucifugimonas marina TaxID=3038979 RepID=A0AAJ5ZFH9_9CHLR|nr:pyruvate dehydrogenase (acetyl-transferring) E1 component subunit alpha [SAR202 cluster bacterium JH702]MDG0868482.1 pyruvate dehydrogenase (acetyl-transferring) E1 component subunit alpha [SAR202 cluster bacterium JH639]WFG35115.1 pyruvate dehydrogenase (acetyl-transferring) E1 component subunit alpha [SAR202 cluster bacterium JH545]WFG39071.1 pyruvate dehydrogenase (acetyl-transferring) E1 component subunit alpha [SAR202 cluster bacterium JH1073]
MASSTKSSSKTSSKSAKSSKNGKSGTAGQDDSGVGAKTDHLELFRQMYLIRQFEIACGENYSKGLIRGFLHLYIGQEATGVGAITSLRDDDYIVSAYRDHGHALARGLDVNRSMAELFGRATGTSKGKGGSMHLFDAAKGFMGGHAIVGGQLPLAAGLALAQQYEKTDALTICFFGDGSTNQGIYHETMNLAAVWKLPVLFFLENNMYGMGSSIERVRAGGIDFYPGMATYGIPAAEVDGMDVLAVKEATELAVERIRNGEGPQFIEAKTFRFVGHSLADGQKYRGQEEVKEWEERDPIVTFPAQLIERGLATADQVDEIKAAVDEEVAKAVEFAEQSPEPELSEIHNDVLA